jgi:hypothetical protein
MFDINTIEKVYAGKCGCMCGCNGRYSYNKDVKREEWQGKVNIARLKRIAEEVFNDERANFRESRDYVFVEDRDENVMKVVYFKKS